VKINNTGYKDYYTRSAESVATVRVSPDELFKARKREDFLRRSLDSEIVNFR
jgi:hypothetical protein